jgi:hypothetical protein
MDADKLSDLIICEMNMVVFVQLLNWTAERHNI